MNKSLATKFKNFLLKNGATFYKDSDNSSYYKYGSKKIRVSDHLPAIFGADIYVMLPIDSNQFIVAINKHITIFPNYSKVTDFFKNYFLLVDCNDEETKNLEKKIKAKYNQRLQDEISNLEKSQRKRIEAIKEECVHNFNNEVQGILIDGKVIPFNLFTAKQKKHILGFLDMTEHIKNIAKISE